MAGSSRSPGEREVAETKRQAEAEPAWSSVCIESGAHKNLVLDCTRGKGRVKGGDWVAGLNCTVDGIIAEMQRTGSYSSVGVGRRVSDFKKPKENGK